MDYFLTFYFQNITLYIWKIDAKFVFYLDFISFIKENIDSPNQQWEKCREKNLLNI